MNEEYNRPQMTPATPSERTAEIAAIVASAAPWIGGPIAEIVGGIAANLKVKRLTQFVADVLDHVDKLHTAASEQFVKSEDFADIFEKTATYVANERAEAKRRLFAQFLRNNIASPEITYDKRLKCVRTLEQIDTRHIDLLRALIQPPTQAEASIMMSAPVTTIESRSPHLRADLATLVRDTNSFGLTNVPDHYLTVNMTGHGASHLAHTVTELGHDLLNFIAEDE